MMGTVLFKLFKAQGKRCKVDDLLMHMHNSIRFYFLQGKKITYKCENRKEAMKVISSGATELVQWVVCLI